MKQLTFVLFVLISVVSFAQTRVGVFENAADIGNPKTAGTSHYDEKSQEYSMKGGGYNIWFNRDEFQYLYNKIKGDFILTANFEFVGEGKDPHRKIGWMVRSTTDPESAHVSGVLHGDGLIVLQWRELRGAYMRDPEDEIFFKKKKAQVMQLERSGKTITMRVANPGEPLQLVGSHTMDTMPEEMLAGMFICSHSPDVAEEAKIWNVRIDQPVADGYNPGKDGWLGCRMELLDVTTGVRKVIHEIPGRFEAPNWMPDGKNLLFNQDGSIFKIPVEGGTPEKLNTGNADRNNNDHGISFDGKLLAISSHRQGLPGGGSTVYVLPIGGGTPKQITEATPSYWHGWAPNNKEVLYVGQRGESKLYHIYRASINGGPEVALTNHTFGHVDGPEYSPDGKYIYYNGNQSGTMQVWRMKPDGSGKEQVTFDQNHNWFPHISPDGKWLAFISFPPDIEPNAHPSYKRVTLNVMPLTTGGAPRVIAYLYGGQGTINVPSWSPDSKKIAFVSNSKRAEVKVTQ
jgi:Tol biopolymer transport system component